MVKNEFSIDRNLLKLHLTLEIIENSIVRHWLDQIGRMDELLLESRSRKDTNISQSNPKR